jgi:hypothetical protein
MLLAVFLLACACNITINTNPSSQQPTEAASATAPEPPTATATSLPPTATNPPMPEPTATQPVISQQALWNMDYELPYNQKTVKLTNGSYAGEGADTLSVQLLDIFALGDLNGDSATDAAVILSEDMGGSGTFISLVVVSDQNGKLVQTAAAQLGDRQQINSIAIHNSLITLDMIVHGPNDPMCCPSQPTSPTYTLASYGLVLTQLTSKTSDGSERAIILSSPAAETQVGNSIQVKGSVTIAPFENTLAYRLTDSAGNLVAQGSIMVTSAEMGGQGTFDSAIDLAQVPAGATFRLSILDLSAADGSVMAMDSVELTCQ